MVQDHQKEIQSLKEENATLLQIIQEQKTELESANTERKANSRPNPPLDLKDLPSQSQENNSKQTLLIGDSMINGINERGLLDTTVNCLSGAKVSDAHSELQNVAVDKYDAVIIHVGTNNCSSHQKLQEGIKDYKTLVTDVKSRAPDTEILLSTICKEKIR